MMATIVFHDLANVITTTLLHSLWQVTLIALVFKYAKSGFLKENSLHVSQLGVAMLFVVLVSTLFTFIYCFGSAQHWLESDLNDSVPSPLAVSSKVIQNYQTEFTPSIGDQWINNIHLHITITWLLGFSILMGRMFWGFLGLQNLKQTLKYNVPVPILKSFIEIRRTLKVSKKVLIATSDKIDIPMVFGHLKPIIVLPLVAISHLSSKEVEYIIAHEMGHILRNDYLKNIVIVISESLFFFHPLIWWMTSEIKQSREHHCDEISIECFPNRVEYAKSLLKVEALRNRSNGPLSLALFTNKPLLMNRIKRILKQPVSNSNQLSARTGIGVAILFFCLFLGASWISKESLTNTIEGQDINEEIESQNYNSPKSFLFIDTIKPDSEEIKMEEEIKIEEAHARIEELHEEIRVQQEEKLASLREIKEEFNVKMHEQKEELRVLQNEYRSERNQMHSERNKLHSKRNHRKLEARLERLGERMEDWMEENGEEWESHIEEMSDRISETFNEEWVEKMEAVSEGFAEQFDDGWGNEFQEKAHRLKIEFEEKDFSEGMAAFSVAMAELGGEIGITVAEAMEDANFEDLEYDLEFGLAENSDDLKISLGEEMAEDFELKKGKNKLSLTSDQLVVNGRRASNDLLEKYKEIVEDGNADAFKVGKTKIKFYFFGQDIQESDKTSLSITTEE